MSEILPLIPLRGLCVYPGRDVHFDLGREKSITALERAMMLSQTVFLLAQTDENVDLPTIADMYSTGTVASVKQILKLPGDNVRVLVTGLYRAQLVEITQSVPYFLADIEKKEDDDTDQPDASLLAYMRCALGAYKEYAKRHNRPDEDKLSELSSIKQPGSLADAIASMVALPLEIKQQLLDILDVSERLRFLIDSLNRDIAVSDLEAQLNSKVKAAMDKNQREYYLHEKLKVIQEELGDSFDASAEAEDFRERLYQLHLSDSVTEKLDKEINRFSRMQYNSADASVSRTYIETILDLPWYTSFGDDLDLNQAEKILNDSHFGLEKIKDRIIEYLAVRKLTAEDKSPILCLVGPPGVGKTSIAKAVAEAAGRKFVHMSLGGVRDEAEIRGHRRTYIGAIPGRVMTLIKECGSNDPVFLFDEVDKIGADYRGDPADALLEVLDPEQNKEFEDHYLEIPFDLSKVLFITTANDAGTIPSPLLDRMEIIEVPGYTSMEKFEIAKKYLIPKQIKANGLSSSNITFSKTAIESMIEKYTRESGVRALEKTIAKVCRKVARKLVEGCTDRQSITAKNIAEYLGPQKVFYDSLLGKNEIGVATGLAWTAVGGETLFIETLILPGQGHIILTGQLGDVMQESAKAAVSYLRAHQHKYHIDSKFYKEKDIHIHIPEGAVPKDGPSAGVTLTVSVLSALTKRAVRRDIAMTGEISLRGKVLPVGGIREKMLAAYRMGIRKALLPEENIKDLDELPSDVRDVMNFVPLKTIDDAVKEALV